MGLALFAGRLLSEGSRLPVAVNNDQKTNMNEAVANRCKAFYQKHGGDDHALFFKGLWRFEDGATAEEFSSLGFLKDPDPEEYQRLQDISIYHQGRLEQATKAFNDLKAQLAMSPWPDEMGMTELKRLKSVVEEKQFAYDSAVRHLEGSPEGKRRAQSKQSDQERRIALESFHTDVKSMNVR